MSRPTVHTLEFSEEDLAGGADYGSFEPGNYVGVLDSVEDVTATSTGNVGWKWKFSVNGLLFDTVTWLKGGGVWKLNEIVNALGGELAAGSIRLDPMVFVGSRAGVSIGRDAKSKYPERLTILRTFPLADEEAALDGPQEL